MSPLTDVQKNIHITKRFTRVNINFGLCFKEKNSEIFENKKIKIGEFKSFSLGSEERKFWCATIQIVYCILKAFGAESFNGIVNVLTDTETETPLTNAVLTEW